jgi:serine/threonine protein kinase
MSESQKEPKLKTGSTLGPYTISRLIGEGGMGEVYKAYDTTLNRHVALKIISGKLSQNDDIVKRFVSEGQTLARLNHQNVVTVYTQGEENGIYYIAMEYVEGKSLDQYSSGRTLSPAEVVVIFKQILEGVKALHDCGIIHRDLKPKNIIVRNNNSVKIVDFGIAKTHSTTREMDLTSTGVLVGSVYYLAPELIKGEPASIQSDIWSIGVIFYELLVGRRPFLGDSQFSIMEKIKNDDIRFPVAKSLEIPDKLRYVIEKMLDKRVGLRYSSTADILRDLKRVEKNKDLQPVKVERSSRPEVPTYKEDTSVTRTNVYVKHAPIWISPIKKLMTFSVFVGAVALYWNFIHESINPTEEPQKAISTNEAITQNPEINLNQQTTNQIATQPQPNVALLEPKNDQEIWQIPFKKIDLKWSPSQIPETILQVSGDDRFQKIEFERFQPTSPLTLELSKADQIYYWRLIDKKMQPISATQSFKLISTQAPETLSPYDQEQITSDQTLKFQWRPKWQAKKYRWQVSKDSNFQKIFKEQLVFDTLIEEKNFPIGKYFWRIRAENSPQATSSWSDIKSFLIKEKEKLTQHQMPTDMRIENRPVSINMRTIAVKPVKPKLAKKDPVKVASSKNNNKNISKNNNKKLSPQKIVQENRTNKTVPVASKPTQPRVISMTFDEPRSPASVPSTSTSLEVPKIKLPPRGVSVVSMGDTASPIVFSWSKVNEATSYKIEIAADDNFSKILHQTTSSDIKVVITTPLPKGRIFWRMRAENKNGKSEWTSPNYFEIEK